MRYRHRQRNQRVPLVFAAAAAVLVIGVSVLLRRGDIAIIVATACALILYMVASLTTLTIEVDDADLFLSFGFGSGFLRRRVPLAEIMHIERLDMPWWAGIGVKREVNVGYITYVVIPGPVLELTMKNSASIRFSTDEPDVLLAILKPR
jgi:hypothetical protein